MEVVNNADLLTGVAKSPTFCRKLVLGASKWRGELWFCEFPTKESFSKSSSYPSVSKLLEFSFLLAVPSNLFHRFGCRTQKGVHPKKKEKGLTPLQTVQNARSS